MHAARNSLLTILLMLLPLTAWAAGPNKVPEPGTFPWRATTVTKLNLRSGPGTGYASKGVFDEGAFIIVDYRTTTGNWVKVSFTDKVQGPMEGYVEGTYLNYVSQINPPAPEKNAGGVWDSLYRIVRVILWICAAIIILGGALDTGWGGPALLLQLFCGVGALIGWLAFQNGKAGAVIGMGLGVLLGARYVISELNLDVDFGGMSWIPYYTWCLVSLPFYLLDLLQFWLSKPWRFLLKRNTMSDKSKPAMRKFLRVMQVPFYLLLFPLRFVNAVYYNIVIHNVYELSNYVLEVVAPSDEQEGGDSFWGWLLYLPVRIVKYIFGHWLLTIVESLIWTVIDTFIPAVTLYHGTGARSADSMLCEPRRNKQRRKDSGWLSGIWNVGSGNYAGDGIYFGIFRKTLRNYEKGSAIVARVTMGKTIDVSLMPDYIYRQAGHADACAVSDWGLDHGYVSGEWWRSDRYTDWWEICLYDRQNKYNEMWRIRPIYAINSKTGIMQRVSGGTAHWLFRKMVFRDMKYTLNRILKKRK